MKLNILLPIFTVLLLSMSASSQITYSNGKLNINQAENDSIFSLTINKWLGMKWTCKEKHFFQIDVSPNNPRIAGTGDAVVFYNTATKTYNNIQVGNVYNLAINERDYYLTDMPDDALRAIRNIKPTIAEPKNSPKRIGLNENEWNIGDHTAFKYDSLTIGGPKIDDIYIFPISNLRDNLPGTVKTDENGLYLINYNSITAILTKAIQELDAKVIQQEELINSLLTENVMLKTQSSNPNKILGCSPNPASDYAEFTLQLEPSVNDATLFILDAYGNLVRKINVEPSLLTFREYIGGLNKGVHLVSLTISGQVVDTYRLLIK